MNTIHKKFVRMKSDPGSSGILLGGEKSFAGARMVDVHFSDGQVKWLPLSALEPVPETPEKFNDLFSTGKFVDPDWLRRTLTRLRVTGKLTEVVYSMEATETDFYAYQFKPVVKLMNSPTDALLIADEVGLGKTIEAGLIWTELRARLNCDRLLVACPKTLCPKWQEELARKFGVDARIGNARELLETLRQSRETGRGYALVCSMQGLRPPRAWKDGDLESDARRRSARGELARFLDDASDGEPLIDLLVVDEAHHMRNPNTLLRRFGLLASSVSSHRLFLSATPIHLRNRDLHSLLSMIDPDTFEFQSTLDDLITTNAPVIAARDLLLSPKTELTKLNEKLDEAQNYAILRDSKALVQIRQELDSKHLDRSTRSELAARLERVNQLANYVTRTRRRDVEELRAIRQPKAPTLKMDDDERFFYNEISDVVRNYAEDRDTNELFLLSTPQRLLTSSLAAASNYWCGLAGTTDIEEIEESDRDLQYPSLNSRPLVTRIAAHALTLGLTSRLAEVDTKYRLLIKELNGLWASEANSKVIVFSSFKPTLHYLYRRLCDDGVGTELLHGSVNRPRTEILSRFKESDDILVLLSSEVGSEGVDLQFSSVVVNYDLPWNPMRLEQRIGRVDRLGQSREQVTILNLIYDETIDRRIYDRLYLRLQIGKRALGEMEAILGEPIRKMTMKLLNPKLPDHLQERVINQTAQALENRRQLENQLEAEAGSLVRHGDYILERITESRDRHRWIRGDDILIYVRDRVLRDFPGSVIEASPAGSDTFRITLSPKGTAEFQSFLNRHGLKGRSRLLNGGPSQRFRFTSSVVQKNSRVECISQLHPLVQFAAARDRTDAATRNAQAVAARISSSALPNEFTPGLYVLAARHWSTGSAIAGTAANIRIGFAGADVATGTPIGADLAEQVMVTAAEKGQPILNAGRHDGLASASKTLDDVVLVELDRQFERFRNQATAEIEDRLTIRQRSLDRHFENKIATLDVQQSKLALGAQHAENCGDLGRATKMKNLVSANEARIGKLRNSWQLRANEIEAQRSVAPGWSDVACLLLQVEP